MSGSGDQALHGDQALQTVLAGALGECVIREEPALELAGCQLQASLRPRSREELGELLRALSEAGIGAVVQGGGSRPGLGNPARGAGVRLCTGGLSGVEELDVADGVLRAAAGTPLRELRAALAPHGWELPLDPPGAAATLGGVLASAASGPRRLAFGPVRDCVLGLDVALACGEHTCCGGRVVKNVTGYDLAKLYVGSLGTLGVIEAAWLRLRPRPRVQSVLSGGLAASPAAFALALAAARRPSVRVAALVSRPLALAEAVLRPRLEGADAWLLVCEVAGDEASCKADADWLVGRGVAEPGGGDLVDAVRALEAGPGAIAPPAAAGVSATNEATLRGSASASGAVGADTVVRARLRLLPSAIDGVSARLAREGFALLVQPLPGVVHAFLGAGEPDADGRDPRERVAAGLRAIEEVRREAGCEYVLEALPSWARAGRDVFSFEEQTLPLMRALKARFDPGGVLNPGRFAGGL